MAGKYFNLPFKEVCKYDVTAANVIVTKVIFFIVTKAIFFEVKKNIVGGNSTIECIVEKFGFGNISADPNFLKVLTIIR